MVTNKAKVFWVSTIGLLGLILILTIPLFLKAGDFIASGNELLLSKQYDAALEKYEKASLSHPEQAELYFNKGLAYYYKEDYPKAKEALEKAALKLKEPQKEAQAKYNLGNCAFREAQKLQSGELEKALAGYQESIRYYQEALKLDPKIQDAACNIEVVRLIIKDILDQIQKKKEEMEKQQKQQEEIMKKLQELLSKQEEMVAQNKTLSQEEKKEDVDQKKNREKLQKDQKKNQEETTQLSQKLQAMQNQKNHNAPPDAGQESPLQKAQNHLNQSATEQAIAQNHLKQEKLPEALPNQQEALEELKKAMQALQNPSSSENQQQQQKQSQQGQSQQQNQQVAEKQKQEKKSQKEAEQAQNILQEEESNKKQKQQNQSGYYNPVEKDW